MESQPAPQTIPSTNSLQAKLLVLADEIGCIIGMKGEIIKHFREESGARITISEGTTMDRVVTIAGMEEAVFKGISLIVFKLEEVCSSESVMSLLYKQVFLQESIQAKAFENRPGVHGTNVKLIVPAAQCGYLIGKNGSRIQQIRSATNVNMQVSTLLLPESTERIVFMSGEREALVDCIFRVYKVMAESPAKLPNIPYRPKYTGFTPLIVNGQYGIPGLNQADLGVFSIPCGANGPVSVVIPSGAPIIYDNSKAPVILPNLLPTVAEFPKMWNPPNVGVGGIIPGFTAFNPSTFVPPNPVPVVAKNTQLPQKTYEMIVPNDLIGCIIGKGGSKIAEIRQLSGAIIRISTCEDRTNREKSDRTITITGGPESVALAQFLINASLETQKLTLLIQNGGVLETSSDARPFVPIGMPSSPEPASVALSQPEGAHLLAPFEPTNPNYLHKHNKSRTKFKPY